MYRKYLGLRPTRVKHTRCTVPRIGIHTFAQFPRKVAEYLQLPGAETYIEHCFRRSLATLLADYDADITTLKRHGG
jgi:hypothetical protein